MVKGRWRNILAIACTGLSVGPLAVYLSASSFTLACGLLIGVVVSVSMLMWPFWALFLTVISVPIERIGRFTNDSSQYTFSLMRAMGLITLAALLLQVSVLRRKLRVPLPTVLYGIYLLFGLFSLTYTTDSFDGIRQLPAFFGNLLFLFLIPNLVRTRPQVKLLLVAWLTVTTAIGVFTIYGWHKGSAVTDSRFHSTGERSTDERFAVVLQDQAEFDLDAKIPRALGPTSHPAVYAINNIMTLPFFAWLITYSQKNRYSFLAAAGGLVVIYNVLLTNTRAALIAMCFVLALIVVTGLIRLNWRIAAVVVVLAFTAVPLLPSALYARIFRTSNYTAQRSATLSARFLYWGAAWDAFTEHPLLGVGIGNQSEIPARVKSIHTPANSSAHCEYLFSLIEVGLIGYSVLVSFFVVLYRRCRKTERFFRSTGERETAAILTAARVLFWGVLFYALQVDCFHFPLKGWWLVMGLVLALSDMTLAKERPVAHPAPEYLLAA